MKKKRCPVHGLLPVSSFRKNKSRTDGLAGCCKQCSKGWDDPYNQKRRGTEKGKQQNSYYVFLHNLERLYGMTKEQYDALLRAQGGRCAICHKPLDGPRRPSIDHNHETGEVRGLLCSACNRGLGAFQDDKKILKAALTYLDL